MSKNFCKNLKKIPQMNNCSKQYSIFTGYRIWIVQEHTARTWWLFLWSLWFLVQHKPWLHLVSDWRTWPLRQAGLLLGQLKADWRDEAVKIFTWNWLDLSTTIYDRLIPWIYDICCTRLPPHVWKQSKLLHSRILIPWIYNISCICLLPHVWKQSKLLHSWILIPRIHNNLHLADDEWALLKRFSRSEVKGQRSKSWADRML